MAGIQDEGMAQFALARPGRDQGQLSLPTMTSRKQHVWKTHDALSSTGGTLTVIGLGHIGQCLRQAGPPDGHDGLWRAGTPATLRRG